MSSSIREIIELLSQPGAGGYQEVVDLANDAPDSAVDLVIAGADMPKSSTALEAALELVDESRLPDVATAAVRALERGADPEDSQAASLIADLSLQSPKSLAPHLDALWEFRPNEGAYVEDWPWRAVNAPAALDKLTGLLDHDDRAIRRRAWSCLLESRTDRGWDEAIGAIGPIIEDDWWAQGKLRLVGVERSNGSTRLLSTPEACHIEFPAGFLRPPTWNTVAGRIEYPTWHLATEEVGSGRFGGWADGQCKVCEQRLHRLLSIRLRPDWLDVPSEVVTCMSCLGWSVEVLFFRHAGDAPTPAGWVVPTQEPEFPAEALPEADVRLRRTPARWSLQDWALSNSRQNLNRVGGEPTWIQNADYPNCPECSTTMSFVMQLDSLDIEGGPYWMWGSGGILYVFWCSECSISATSWQCT